MTWLLGQLELPYTWGISRSDTACHIEHVSCWCFHLCDSVWGFDKSQSVRPHDPTQGGLFTCNQ